MRPKYIPKREIEFAARVGFLTKGLWREYFAEGKECWQNRIWRRLKRDGVFLSHSGTPDLYILNPKHPLLSEWASVVAKPPILTQLFHDELVARSYMQLKRGILDCDLKTEAYLKKEVPLSNKGVRVQDAEKHPDLVLNVKGVKTAIEIELSQKSRGRYRSILRCYRRSGFTRVIYLIGSEGIMNAVESAAIEVSFPKDKIALGFGSVGHWRVNPFETKIHFDRESRVLREVIVP